jgi:hypothetical protein
MEPAKEFPSFPLLPKEIRLLIWHCAAKTHKRIILFRPPNKKGFPYDNVPISLLSVNREARDETLKSYTKIEPIKACGKHSFTVFGAPLYFKPFRDMVRMSADMVFDDGDMLLRGFEKNGICPDVTPFDEEDFSSFNILHQ